MHERGGELLAISVDTPEESARVVAKHGLTFPILSDPDTRVVRQYGVLHPRGNAITGSDIAIPSQFLFDRAGKLVWRYISDRTQDRAAPALIADQIRKLN